MKKLQPLAVLALAVGLLVGCGGPSTPVQPQPGAEPAVVLSPEASEQQTPGQEPAASDEATPRTVVDRALIDRAMATALKQVDGRIISIDVEDHYIEIEVLTGNQIKEVKVDLLGERVLGVEDETDLEDIARAKAAKITVEQALDTAFSHAPGEFEEIELDSYRGVIVWEVEFRTPDGMKSELNIDASTGKVVR
jgi:uncharacterized membrane protein YkoI